MLQLESGGIMIKDGKVLLRKTQKNYGGNLSLLGFCEDAIPKCA